jgi:hypothetical protein
MQLLEIIGYGPNNFGTHKKSRPSTQLRKAETGKKVRAVQRTPARFGPGGARPPMGVPGAVPRSTSGAAFPLPPSGQKLV